jgi:tRNA-specific 2-thiouridylase
MEKSEVRTLAATYNLPVATKKDSQGLCFVGTIDVKTLLKEYIDERPGSVINEEGESIGSHEGVMFYTLGERHGFTITKKGTDDSPYFVIAKDLSANTLTVSHVPPKDKQSEVISLSKVNWTVLPTKGGTYEARARYRAPLATVEVVDDTHVKVLSGELVSTPGQSLVLYDDGVCLGGGIIN